MDPQDYLDRARRDAILGDAICRALYAMALTNGCPISMDGVNAVLNFDLELAQLRRALALLEVDAIERFAPPAPPCSTRSGPADE